MDSRPDRRGRGARPGQHLTVPSATANADHRVVSGALLKWLNWATVSRQNVVRRLPYVRLSGGAASPQALRSTTSASTGATSPWRLQ